jgi:hypothetical protein
MSATATAQGMGVPADSVGNLPSNGTELLLVENAHIERLDDRVSISLKLVTPEAASYTYPEGIEADRQAQPELFTGWAFIFNNPELCETPYECGMPDFNDQVKTGVYNFAGFTNQLTQSSGGDIELNAATDGYVVLTGDVMVGQPQLPPVREGTTTHPFEDPEGALIHVAVAPHGLVDATTIAEEIYEPAGNPTCECWWTAFFDPADAPSRSASQ